MKKPGGGTCVREVFKSALAIVEAMAEKLDRYERELVQARDKIEQLEFDLRLGMAKKGRRVKR